MKGALTCTHDVAASELPPTYDPRGNLASEGGPTFLYSSENLLTGFVSHGRTMSWTWDPLMRLNRITTSGANPRTYLFDGCNLILQNINGAMLSRYVYGPGEPAPGEGRGADLLDRQSTPPRLVRRRRARLDPGRDRHRRHARHAQDLRRIGQRLRRDLAAVGDRDARFAEARFGGVDGGPGSRRHGDGAGEVLEHDCLQP